MKRPLTNRAQDNEGEDEDEDEEEEEEDSEDEREELGRNMLARREWDRSAVELDPLGHSNL